MTIEENVQALKVQAIAWCLFSVFFVSSALIKPFHVHEFYSWVYSLRYNYKDILQLKEFGIGHPPLYHLVQKIIQDTIPIFFPYTVRLANFLFGSIFVIVMTAFIAKRRYSPLFCYAVSINASVLNVYLFSRMWGLVLLSTALLLYTGETYREQRNLKYLYAAIGACILGALSDYNFILTIFYVLFLFTDGRVVSRRIVIASAASTIVLWISFRIGQTIYYGFDISKIIYSLFYNSLLLVKEISKTIGYFVFDEYIVISCLFLIIAFYKDLKKKYVNNEKKSLLLPLSLLFFIMISSEMMLRRGIVSATSICMITVSIFAIFYKKILLLSKLKVSDVNLTIIFSILGGVGILLTVNTIFWTNLVSQRFIIIFYPFLIYLILLNFEKAALNTVSVIMLVSAIIYVPSFTLMGQFPPPAVPEGKNVVFADVYSYSNQYFHYSRATGYQPIINRDRFQTSCRVCDTGVAAPQFEPGKTYLIVGEQDLKLDKIIPIPFRLVSSALNLSLLDKMHFSLLSPVSDTVYAVYEIKTDS